MAGLLPPLIAPRDCISRATVYTNEDRIVTAMALDASRETKAIAAMLGQGARMVGSQAEKLRPV